MVTVNTFTVFSRLELQARSRDESDSAKIYFFILSELIVLGKICYKIKRVKLLILKGCYNVTNVTSFFHFFQKKF